jgi:hypothetical protein
LSGMLNLLFDSVGPEFASLLQHCHTSAAETPEPRRLAIVL